MPTAFNVCNLILAWLALSTATLGLFLVLVLWTVVLEPRTPGPTIPPPKSNLTAVTMGETPLHQIMFEISHVILAVTAIALLCAVLLSLRWILNRRATTQDPEQSPLLAKTQTHKQYPDRGLNTANAKMIR